MTPCPVCAWFQENFPNEYAARDTEGKHERAAWFMLGRIQALEAEAQAKELNSPKGEGT